MRFSAALAMLVLVSAAMLLETTNAETYEVGDTLGWSVPTDPTAYATWAAQHTFVVGDVLVFTFGTGQHSVARVTKAAYDACNSANPISISPVGPTNITLDTPGEEFFFCSVGQHCRAGQKFAINVTDISPTPSPRSPTPPPVSRPPSATPPVSGPPSPSVVPPTPGPSSGDQAPPPVSGTPPTGSVLPPPPSSGGASPPPTPNAARATNVASIFVIFISGAIAIML